MAEYDALLEFWVGDVDDSNGPVPPRSSLWFSKDDAVDGEIRERFGPHLDALAETGLAEWMGDLRGRLAAIILADQFSRNLYRGSARAFALDDLACGLALRMIADGEDRKLHRNERVFVYLPLEHAESLALQEQSVELFEALSREVPEPVRAAFEDQLDYAVRHRDIIARFGRFPHRNAALGRVSTPEEEAFLKQPGSSF